MFNNIATITHFENGQRKLGKAFAKKNKQMQAKLATMMSMQSKSVRILIAKKAVRPLQKKHIRIADAYNRALLNELKNPNDQALKTLTDTKEAESNAFNKSNFTRMCNLEQEIRTINQWMLTPKIMNLRSYVIRKLESSFKRKLTFLNTSHKLLALHTSTVTEPMRAKQIKDLIKFTHKQYPANTSKLRMDYHNAKFQHDDSPDFTTASAVFAAHIREISLEFKYKCPICMTTGPHKPKCNTHCGHVFHRACISKWTKHNSTCPLCRQQIPEVTAL